MNIPKLGKHKIINKTNLIILLFASLFCLSLIKINKLESEIASLKSGRATSSNKESVADKYEVLNKLSVEVQVNYFDKLLGNPLYINSVEDKNLKKYVYVDEDFYVQAITNINDKVLSYSITSRKKDFNPTFEMSGLFKVSLNKTPFSEWITDKFEGLPVWYYRFLGAHDPIYYFEEISFGNPGLYLTHLVGVNNSAFFDDIPSLKSFEDKNYLWHGPVNNINQEDRKNITPNTFIVRGILLDVKEEDLKKVPGVWFGPDNVQLRTLNE